MKLYEKYKDFLMNNLMYIIVEIYLLSLMLGYTSVVQSSEKLTLILKLIRYICYIAFGIKIYKDWKNGSKMTYMILVLICIAILAILVEKSRSVFFLVLFAIAIRNMKFDKIINYTFKVYMVVFILTINLAILGIVPNWLFFRGNVERYALGFIYATDAMGIYLIIMIMFFYQKRSKASWMEIALSEAINVLLYKFTDSRLSFILINALLILLCLSKINWAKNILYKKSVQNVLKTFCYVLPIALFLIFNLMTVLYVNNNEFAIKANILLSERFRITGKAYDKYGVPVFGKNIEWIRMGRK